MIKKLDRNKFKIGTKPTLLFTKSIWKRNLPRDKVYNPTLGTTHTILPGFEGDPTWIDGLCHYIETLHTVCPQCYVKAPYREMWATEDYSIMFCRQCKFYIWKTHESNIEKAWKDTNFLKLQKPKKKIIVPILFDADVYKKKK